MGAARRLGAFVRRTFFLNWAALARLLTGLRYIESSKTRNAGRSPRTPIVTAGRARCHLAQLTTRHRLCQPPGPLS